MTVVSQHLTDLAGVLRAAGCDVVEIPGWRTRGRPAETGGFTPAGVLWHHTGPGVTGRQGAEWMALTGRPDLPAPLAQLSVGRDGTWYVLASGRANHAGEARPSGPVPGGDGNTLYLGVEAQHDGSEAWPPTQRAAMLRGGAALGAGSVGCPPDAHRGHKETSVTGKWDPGNFDMTAFRRDLTTEYRRQAAPPPPPGPPPGPQVFQVITANIKHALPDTQAAGMLSKLAATTGDILALQEMGGRRALLEGVTGFTPAVTNDPATTTEGSSPLLIRDTVFTVKRVTSIRASNRVKVPAKAAGPPTLPAYIYTHAALLHPGTGRTVHAVSVHLPASQQIPELRALADQCARAVADTVRTLPGQVVVAGDWNTETPLTLAGGVLATVGLQEITGVPDVPTLGRRAIDRVLYKGLRLEGVSRRAVDGLPSDHRPLLARFTLEGKRGAGK